MVDPLDYLGSHRMFSKRKQQAICVTQALHKCKGHTYFHRGSSKAYAVVSHLKIKQYSYSVSSTGGTKLLRVLIPNPERSVGWTTQALHKCKGHTYFHRGSSKAYAVVSHLKIKQYSYSVSSTGGTKLLRVLIPNPERSVGWTPRWLVCAQPLTHAHLYKP